METPSGSLIGLKVDNRYSIGELVSAGGMAFVYKGTDEQQGRSVALKVLRDELCDDIPTRRRLQREARVLGALNHPNIVSYTGSGELPSGQPFLVLEYISGKTLADIVDASGPMPVDRALPVFVQLSDAMRYLHELGIVHRDISPANIILASRGAGSPDTVKLIDLGIMKCDESWQTSSGVLTAIGDIIGNPMYLSPEQALGQASDARSDIYSLGVIMWETLAGKPPFAGLNIAEMINRHAYERFPKLTDIRKDLPPRLVSVVERCLEKSPDNRFQSMIELQRALTACESTSGSKGGFAGTFFEVAGVIGAAVLAALVLCLVLYKLLSR